MKNNLIIRLYNLIYNLCKRTYLFEKENWQNLTNYFAYREMLDFVPNEKLQQRISSSLLMDLQEYERTNNYNDGVNLIKNYFSASFIPQELTNRIIKELKLERFIQDDIYIYGTLFRSSYSEKDYSSKLFHRDFASVRMFKVFIYLNDVISDEHGPLMLIRNKVNWYDDFFPLALHKPKHWEEKQIKKNGLYKFLGNAGETALLNTNKYFHLGSRVGINNTRKAIIVNFQLKKSLIKNKFVKYL